MSVTTRIAVQSACENLAEAEPLSFLVLASGQAAEDAAHALQMHLHGRVQVVPDHLACLRTLQGDPVTVVIVEESAASADPAGIDAIYEAAGAAVLLEVNLGITDGPRLVRQIRSALRHRQAEKDRAKAAVRAELRQELAASLAGLLLESQLGLRQAGPQLAPTLQRLVGLAEHVCSLIRDPQSGTESTEAGFGIRGV